MTNLLKLLVAISTVPCSNSLQLSQTSGVCPRQLFAIQGRKGRSDCQGSGKRTYRISLVPRPRARGLGTRLKPYVLDLCEISHFLIRWLKGATCFTAGGEGPNNYLNMKVLAFSAKDAIIFEPLLT